ncbi:uncharacterized protein LOC102154843 isoform X5 [Canis lupus familiaris]|uniref:uncharacterized protein LOC102154843 isoform X5 n=1 Tax=Canis lupus familiaris TaxID=9615 RepID=UPI0018F64C2B|nr:uncharacterized protein LOC102154843 isoform X5 [Canis lupus familiaris]XP_038428929.1 uncharacterized protein LOC102154843 isoform X4 [Canis lupus familiaris]
MFFNKNQPELVAFARENTITTGNTWTGEGLMWSVGDVAAACSHLSPGPSLPLRVRPTNHSTGSGCKPHSLPPSPIAIPRGVHFPHPTRQTSKSWQKERGSRGVHSLDRRTRAAESPLARHGHTCRAKASSFSSIFTSQETLVPRELFSPPRLCIRVLHMILNSNLLSFPHPDMLWTHWPHFYTHTHTPHTPVYAS